MRLRAEGVLILSIPSLQRALGRCEGRPGVGTYGRSSSHHGGGHRAAQDSTGNRSSLYRGLYLDVIVGYLKAGTGALQRDDRALFVARLVHGGLRIVQRLRHVYGLQRVGGVAARRVAGDSLIATLAVRAHSSPSDVTYPISRGMYSGW